MRSNKRRPGRGATRHRPEQSNNNGGYSSTPEGRLAVERAKQLAKGMPAREQEIHTKVLHQLRITGLPTPEHILVLFHEAGVNNTNASCERMARELNGSVLICNTDGKILAMAWPR